jgi:hypothetical protein
MAAMPQWLTGLFAGAAIAWATQALQTLLKRVQYRNEKLIDAYADFVGVLSSDLSRPTELF